MKSIIPLLIPLLVDAAAVGHSLHTRQLQETILNFLTGPPKPAVNVTKGKPDINPEAKKETVRWGPFILNPSNGTHTGGNFKLDSNADVIVNRVTGVCKDCMVLSAQTKIALENGAEAGIRHGVYSHHIIMFDVGRKMVPPPAIPSANGGMSGGLAAYTAYLPSSMQSLDWMMPAISIFTGQGSDGGKNIFAAKNSDVKSGFGIQKQDEIILVAELVNYNNYSTKVFIDLEYEYIPNLPKGFLEVGQYGISTAPIGANGLADMGFKPPHDKPVEYSSPSYPVLNNGYLLNVVPHLHDGGIDIKLFVNKQLVCTSNAVYGGRNSEAKVAGEKWETITAYTPCEKPIQIKKGDTLTMSSVYDLTKHKLRPMSDNHDNKDAEAEGMALATFIFASEPQPK